MSSFVSRQLRASLVLPQGVFAGTNSNTLVLSGNRMSAKLDRTGNFTNSCTLRIYGMKQADMGSVTVIYTQQGSQQAINAKAILILESNDGSGWLQIFEGGFQQAQPDYTSQPDVCLTLMASTGYGQQLLAVSPTSTDGAADAATLAQQLATQMGFAFENNGVQATLHSPYLAGTAMDQFRDLASAAPFDYYFDSKSTLIICPRGQGRQDKIAVRVNAQTGMVGYPTLQQYGIQVTVLFSAAIELASPIVISDSPIPGINGTWYPMHASDDLESVKPDGRWFSTLDCYPSSAEAQ